MIKIDQEGDLPGYGTVYYNHNVAANILSLHNLTKRFKSVTCNNTDQDAFVVQRDDGTTMKFKPSEEGLYYYDFQESIDRQQKLHTSMVVTTVEEARTKFSKREIEAAETARRLYVILGRPSKKTFEEAIKKKKLLFYPITIQDYRNALIIHGEDLGTLKGKTVRMRPNHIQVDTTSKVQLEEEETDSECRHYVFYRTTVSNYRQ
jgi:hypothetical protein